MHALCHASVIRRVVWSALLILFALQCLQLLNSTSVLVLLLLIFITHSALAVPTILTTIQGIVLNALNVKLVIKEDVYLVQMICIFTIMAVIAFIRFYTIWQESVHVQKDTTSIHVLSSVYLVPKCVSIAFSMKIH